MFYGYCLTPDDQRTPAATLDTPQDVFDYVSLQRKLFWKEVRITDSDDYIVVHVVNKKVEFPPEWKDLFEQIDLKAGVSHG